MSILTRVYIQDIENYRVIYDLKTRKYIGYRLPKPTNKSKPYNFVIALCAAASASPFVFRRWLRSTGRGDKIEPLKNSSNLGLVIVILFLIILSATIAFYYITEKELERGGIECLEIEDHNLIAAMWDYLNDYYRDNYSIKESIHNKHFKRNLYTKLLILGFLPSLAFLSIGIVFVFVDNTIEKILASTAITAFGMSGVFYIVIILIYRDIAERRFNKEYRLSKEKKYGR